MKTKSDITYLNRYQLIDWWYHFLATMNIKTAPLARHTNRPLLKSYVRYTNPPTWPIHLQMFIYMIRLIPMFIYIQDSKGLWSVLHSDIHYMLSARINIVIAVEAGCPDEIWKNKNLARLQSIRHSSSTVILYI